MNFEKVSKYANDENLHLPVRKTSDSAGYDFEVAKTTVIPSYIKLMEKMSFLPYDKNQVLTLSDMQKLTKEYGIKPTLVPTGIKAQIDKGFYLQLSVRSSCPLKSWIILANGQGIIDSDYYNNPDNEGEIFFQVINLSPYDILLEKGDIIGQGIILPYLTIQNDNATGQRIGGFGSTSNG